VEGVAVAVAKVECIWFQIAVVHSLGLDFFLYVARNAFLFEYRPDVSVETERILIGDFGLYNRRWSLHCQRSCGYGWGFELVFVASDAVHLFAGVDVGKGSHRLNGHTVFVEELEVDGLIDRRLEVYAAVFFDGDNAERQACDGLAAESDFRFVAVGGCFGDDLDYAKGFYFCAVGQLAVIVGKVDVHDAYRCGGGSLGASLALVCFGFYYQRFGTRPQRNGIDGAKAIGEFGDHFPVAGRIEQDDGVFVVAEVEILTERPGGSVGHVGPVAGSGFGLGEPDVWGDAFYLGHSAVVGDAYIYHYQ